MQTLCSHLKLVILITKLPDCLPVSLPDGFDTKIWPIATSQLAIENSINGTHVFFGVFIISTERVLFHSTLDVYEKYSAHLPYNALSTQSSSSVRLYYTANHNWDSSTTSPNLKAETLPFELQKHDVSIDKLFKRDTVYLSVTCGFLTKFYCGK